MSGFESRSTPVGGAPAGLTTDTGSSTIGKRTLVEGPGQAAADGTESAYDIGGGGAGGGGGGGSADGAPVDVDAMMAGGRPLDASVLAQLEPRFGRNLGEVRIHTEPAAEATVQRMGAEAYTYKNHIAFAPGRYQPGTPEGIALLAHELTHFVQGGGAVDAGGGGGREARPGDAGGAHEHEANAVAKNAATDPHLTGGGPAPGGALQQGLPGQEAGAAAGQKLGQPAAGYEVSQRAEPDRAHRCVGGGGGPARPTLATIMADATVSAELTRAWNESNPNAPAVPSGTPGSTKVEQGGWILWNPTTNVFTVQRVPAGTRDGLATIVGTKPADTATAMVVAWFHTHPNTRAEGYGPDPSPGDLGFTRSAQVPGIIKTHEGDRTIPYP